MNFRELNIKPSYESGTCNMIDDFYLPILSVAKSYDRIAGFFSSSTLAVVAKGIAKFINNGGKMRLITSPKLRKCDSEVLNEVVMSPEKDFDLNLEDIEDEFIANHVKALGWMLKNKLLEIKLAVVISYEDGNSIESGLFHQKVGILTDKDNNGLSFSGSINETASAWLNNDEEFKVFKDWDHSSIFYVDDVIKFNDIWEGKRKNCIIYDLPNAVKHKIIKYSEDFDIESITSYKTNNRQISSSIESPTITLFPYQEEAQVMWSKNGRRLLFEMATGTGKTITAIACIQSAINDSTSSVVIISTPQNTLTKQWQSEVDKFGLKFDESALIDGTNNKWKSALKLILLKNAIGQANRIIIFTTHNTASSKDFLKIMNKNLSSSTKSVFVGDEVHWLGAGSFRRALNDIYDYRIGLSATPTRWFDDDGTAVLTNYFGNNNFVFSIREALINFNPLTNRHFLVNYNYFIKLASLTPEETAQYKYITAKLIKLYSIRDKSDAHGDNYKRWLEKRANIIKNAENKFDKFIEILDELQNNHQLKNLIIFISPEQKTKVKEILISRDVFFHQLTEAEGVVPQEQYEGLSEREFIIKQFKQGEYQALIAIKCLDEGIDIPTAENGILLSSSTNPREYTQRIGRIIRQSPEKGFANLYDIAVAKLDGLDEDELKFEKMIRDKEKIRLTEIAENAINSAEALKVIMKM